MLRESLVSFHVDRLRKEAIATAVSRANACTYCVDAHSAALHALGEAATADALATTAGPDAPASALTPVIAWAAATRFVSVSRTARARGACDTALSSPDRVHGSPHTGSA